MNFTDWLGALSTFATFLVAGIALWFAWGQVKEARAAREQSRRLELEKAQPYVAMWAEIGFSGTMLVDIVVKNFGPTAARNVRFELDPLPMRDDGWGEGWKAVKLPEAIFFLAPGQEWRTFWDSGHREDLSYHNRPHRGRVTYLGTEDGVLLDSPVLMDWSMWGGVLFTDRKGVHDLAKSAEKIADKLSGFSEFAGRGLSVFVRSGREHDERTARGRCSPAPNNVTPPAAPTPSSRPAPSSPDAF